MLEKETKAGRGKEPCKQGTRRHVAGSETACCEIRTGALINWGGSPDICERSPQYVRAVARILFYKLLYEGLGDLEGIVGNGVPEVVILRGIGVAQVDVADDAEGNEGHLMEVARLGDGARLKKN